MKQNSIQPTVIRANPLCLLGGTHRSVQMVLGSPGQPAENFHEADHFLPLFQMTEEDETVISPGQIRSESTEPRSVGRARSEFDPQVLVTLQEPSSTQPQQPMLCRLSVRLMPLEADRSEPLCRNCRFARIIHPNLPASPQICSMPPASARVSAAMAISIDAKVESPPAICERILIRLEPQGADAKCVFSDSGPLLLPRWVMPFLQPGDIFRFPENILRESESIAVHIQRPDVRRDLLFTLIDYARQDHREGQHAPAVTAEVRNKALGISSISLPCDSLRDYFYVGDRRRGWDEQPSFYELLGVRPEATTAELRVAFRLRTLELRATRSPSSKIQALERAFNILGQPALREAYDNLFADSGAGVPFPYNGFGSLLVEGNRSRDGDRFFASRILSFRPQQAMKSLRVPLRNCTFYKDLALYRDPRRQLEISLDSCVLPLPWDPSWNRWKNLLGVKAEIKAVFVQTGAYRYRRGAWELRKWETAVPSRVEVRVSDGVLDQIAKARNNYLRFGQFADEIEEIRESVESTPIERAELQKMCSRLGIPADFDVSLITWKPDYEEFYYEQLSRRARHVYFFRAEYIFVLEDVIVVETPKLGHATYLFSKSESPQHFLTLYRSTTREEILHNRHNTAEKLSFLCRLIHGPSSQSWLQELKTRLGENRLVI